MKKQSLFCLFLPLGGILTGLCLIFPQIGFLEWLALVPALLYLFGKSERTETRYRHYYFYGVFFFLPLYLVVYHWFFALYPMEFAGVGKGTAAALVLFCWIGLSLLQTFFSAFTFPLFVCLRRSGLFGRLPLLTPFLFAAIYTVFEWGQTLTWMGVPWARLALGQSEMGFFWNSASLFGSYFLTFTLVAVNGLIAYAILHLDRVRISAIVAAALFLFNGTTGAIAYFTADTDTSDGVTVAAIQANIGSLNKWNNADGKDKYQVYREMTVKAVAAGAEIVVLPETFIPATLSETSKLGLYVKDLAASNGVTILCGAFYDDAEGNQYNAVFAAFSDGTLSETVYRKRHLVPFGEYMPMRPLIEAIAPGLANLNVFSSDLSAGEDAAVIETAYGKVGSLICFDSIYEMLTVASVREGAEIFCLPTNDSWFRDSAGVRMHHAQARLRAVESGRYIIRAADTGISSVIAPDGTTEAQLPALTEGVSVAKVSFNEGRTLYSYIGNLLVYLLIAALALVTGQRIWSTLKAKKAQKM